jgi:hypothetical protein
VNKKKQKNFFMLGQGFVGDKAHGAQRSKIFAPLFLKSGGLLLPS